MALEISAGLDGKSADLRLGEQVVLRLPENASTGYRWALGELDAAKISLEQTEFAQESPGVGSGGSAIWKLQTRGVGTVVLQAKKWRDWEGENSVTERFRCTLHIRAATREP